MQKILACAKSCSADLGWKPPLTVVKAQYDGEAGYSPAERKPNMTFIVNRRAAFGFLGAGSLTFLTACSGLNINSSASDISDDDQTKEPEKDYRGEVKLESYDTSAGTYRPATRTQPPKNVPKPVKPDNIREESAAGLYSSLAFMIASLQYLFATGDDQYFEQSDLNDKGKRDIAKNSSIKDMFKAFKEGDAWFGNPTITFFLEEPQPTKRDDIYYWPVTFTSDFGEYIVAFGNVRELKETERKSTHKGELTAKYSNGAWHLSDFNSQPPGASASASPSSSI